jgi:Outer membrane protein beta-barrel domain
MKKEIFTVLILLMMSFSTSESQLIRGYGLKIGVASTNQNWDFAAQTGIAVTSTTAHQGLIVGAFIEWLDIPLLSVVTEVQYIRKGSNVMTNLHISTMELPDGNGQFLSYSTRINYLSVPLLAKFRQNGGLWSPYIVAGPRFDYCISSSGVFSTADFNKINIGGTFGIGAESASILPIQLGLEFRYSPDFQNSYSVQGITIKNRSMEFLLVLSM